VASIIRLAIALGLKFLSLCGKQDRLNSGTIDRLLVERVLNGDCKDLIADLPAAVVFDALKRHAGGRGVHSFPFQLNLSLFCPPCNPNYLMTVSWSCSS
jgi:hypothetical protein